MESGDTLRARDGYGLRPGVRAAVARYARRVTDVLGTSAPDDVPDRVLPALVDLLAEKDLLDPAHQRDDPARYRRHVLYADPAGRFTVLALVWRPGQGTSVHGHSAWGAVGVLEGHPNVCCYRCAEDATGDVAPEAVSDRRFGPGDVCAVRPGYGDTHRIYNGTERRVITLHTYGRDLVRDPEAINLVLQP